MCPQMCPHVLVPSLPNETGSLHVRHRPAGAGLWEQIRKNDQGRLRGLVGQQGLARPQRMTPSWGAAGHRNAQGMRRQASRSGGQGGRADRVWTISRRRVPPAKPERRTWPTGSLGRGRCAGRGCRGQAAGEHFLINAHLVLPRGEGSPQQRARSALRPTDRTGPSGEALGPPPHPHRCTCTAQ